MRFKRFPFSADQFSDSCEVDCGGGEEFSHHARLGVRGAISKWKKDGSPYYKIWPGMSSCMVNASVDIDMGLIRFPYTCFEVCGVCDGLFYGMLVVNPVLTQAISHEEFRDVGIGLTILCNVDGFIHSFTQHLCPGKTFLQEFGGNETSIRLCQSDQKLYNSWKVAICTCFFAVENHEVVMPDIQREVIERKYPKARGKAKRIAEEKVEEEIQNHKGWKVGSEIDLPRPLVVRDGKPQDLGGELTCGHIRSGHMRMQACGPGLKERKLIFVPPTVVRPDLPMRQMHGYRIQDTLLNQ